MSETYMVDACGECREGECDHCWLCDEMAAMPGSKPHLVTVVPADADPRTAELATGGGQEGAAR